MSIKEVLAGELRPAESEPVRSPFRRLWLGSGLNAYTQASLNLALPLVALNLQADATWMGLLNAARWLPWLLVGLFAGAWVDRLSAKSIMLVTASLVALTLFSVPLAQKFASLHLAHLLAVALLLGLGEVFTQVSRTKLVSEMTPGPLLEARNARLFGTDAAMQVVGQGSAGPLMQGLGQLTGFLTGGMLQLLAAAAFWFIPARLNRPRLDAPQTNNERPSLLAEIAEGWRVVFHDPALRAMTIIGGIANFGIVGMGSLFFIYMRETLHLSANQISVAMMLGSLGGILGAILAPRLGARLGNGRANTDLLLGEGLSALLVGWPDQVSGVWLTVLGIHALMLSATAGNVLRASWRQRYVFPEVIGRVTTSSAFLNYGLMPLGALLGGFLGQRYGVRPALLMMAGLFLLASASILLTRVGWQKHLPERLIAAVRE